MPAAVPRPLTHHARIAGCILLAALLAGCGVLGGGAGSKNGANGSARTQPADPAFDIRVEVADRALRRLVEQFNQLQRYRSVDDLDATDLERLMALAEQDVRQLLATQGYFDPQVDVRLEGEAGARPTVVIAIEPGEMTTITATAVDFEGDLATTGDAAAKRQRDAIEERVADQHGRDFTQDRWSGIKRTALRQLVETRYPKGRISQSDAQVDAVQSSARLGLKLDSGPPFRLGAASVKGAERYPEWLPERLSWLRPGEVYDQKRLIEAQARLVASGYYRSAFITMDAEGDPAAAPVRYLVQEENRHRLQFGLGYSTDTGPRASIDHRDNTVFGTTWRSSTTLNLNRREPLLQLALTSLPNAHLWRKTALARYMRQDDGTLTTTTRTAQAGIAKNSEKYDRHLYLQFDHATVTGSGDRAVPPALLGDGAAVGINYAWTGRYFDSRLSPTRGYGLGAEVGAGMTVEGVKKPFVRALGRGLAFIPFDSGSRLQLRATAAGVLASHRARLPATYMFRTGGTTTVRGYGYRRIGIDVGDDLVGPGRYMAIASAEWQRPVLVERFPGLVEHTVFVDVGSVADRVGDFRAHWGIGTGVRLLTPVGPMELDLAYGLKSRAFHIHLDVGFVW